MATRWLDHRGPAPAGRSGGDAAPAAQANEAYVRSEAEATLGKLASALFPAGCAELGQLMWGTTDEPPATTMATPGRDSNVERKLWTADLRYRTLIEQIPAVTFLAALGEGENEIYVSPYIETLLGFTQQEWLENPFLWYSQLHPDDRALWHEEFARGIQTGGPFRAECRLIARDGRIVWVRGEARMVRDEAGRPMFLQGVAFDITESKRTHSLELQEAVRTTGQRYRDLVEQLDAIFWEADADTGRFTLVSDGSQLILGFPPDQWISDPAFLLTRVHPDDRALVARVWARALDSGGDHAFDFRAFSVDQREIWLHTRIQAPTVSSREPCLIGVMLDVTERKQRDQERMSLLVAAEDARRVAEAASRAKDDFLATMSHELKTPLAALIGYTQLLRARQLPPAMVESALETIERIAYAQAKLVDDLLDVSRLNTGKLHLEIGPVDLAEVVDVALATMRLAAEAKRITIDATVDRSGLVAAGDPSRLQQVVWNLVSNAVKFTPEQGRIEVCLQRAGDHASIRVSDSGMGIPAEFLPHIFERFRQAEGSTTRRHGGLGLGLAIVREIVELHGGAISAESAGSGQGATFIARLPLFHAQEQEKTPAASGSDDRRHPLERVRVWSSNTIGTRASS